MWQGTNDLIKRFSSLFIIKNVKIGIKNLLLWSNSELLLWSGLVCSGPDWSGLVRSGLVWSGLVWSGLVWSGLAWSGLVWSGLVWSLHQMIVYSITFLIFY
jgi:hypothetical protein